MRATGKILPLPETFTPRELTLTFETQEELNTFRVLFTVRSVCDVLRDWGLYPESIRNAAREIGAQIAPPDRNYLSPCTTMYRQICGKTPR